MGKRYFEEYALVTTKPDKRQKTRKLVMEIKSGSPCTDCNEYYPHYIMEFDHVRGIKLGNIESIARKGDMQLLLDEIAKCDLVCGHCHKHRTWLRLAGKERKRNA